MKGSDIDESWFILMEIDGLACMGRDVGSEQRSIAACCLLESEKKSWLVSATFRPCRLQLRALRTFSR